MIYRKRLFYTYRSARLQSHPSSPNLPFLPFLLSQRHCNTFFVILYAFCGNKYAFFVTLRFFARSASRVFSPVRRSTAPFFRRTRFLFCCARFLFHRTRLLLFSRHSVLPQLPPLAPLPAPLVDPSTSVPRPFSLKSACSKKKCRNFTLEAPL